MNKLDRQARDAASRIAIPAVTLSDKSAQVPRIFYLRCLRKPGEHRDTTHRTSGVEDYATFLYPPPLAAAAAVPVVCIAIVAYRGLALFGLAVTHPNDQVSKARGRQIALGRLRKLLGRGTVTDDSIDRETWDGRGRHGRGHLAGAVQLGLVTDTILSIVHDTTPPASPRRYYSEESVDCLRRFERQFPASAEKPDPEAPCK